MKRYVIERNLPGAGSILAEDLGKIRKTSNAALVETGGVQWVESYVADDRIFCHYLAESEEVVREHARRAGIPCTTVNEVRAVVNPMTVAVQSS